MFKSSELSFDPRTPTEFHTNYLMALFCHASIDLVSVL